MAPKSNYKIISVVHRICCGLDVHKYIDKKAYYVISTVLA